MFLKLTAKEIDPVYSLLKCAADLPKVLRAAKEGQVTGPVSEVASCQSDLHSRYRDDICSTNNTSIPSSSGLQYKMSTI